MKRRYKVSEVLRMLKDDGWVIEWQTGSHRQLRHPTKSGTVTVAGKFSVDIPPKTLNSIGKQSGVEF